MKGKGRRGATPRGCSVPGRPGRLAVAIARLVFTVALLLLFPRVGSAVGSVTSQGDHILRADLARSTFGVTGAGIRVGVISTGILGLDQAKATGDLSPGTCGPQTGGVTAIDPNLCKGIGASVTDDPEGTAVMEIIHDLAPGAELLFCAPNTSLDMAACIDFLSGIANVIVDDLGFYGEPFFQDGIVAQAAAGSVAKGVVYVSAAGNDAQTHYQGMYVNSGDGLGSHQISPGNTFFRITGTDVAVFLQWSDRFGSAGDTYDLCLAEESPAQCAMFNNVENGSGDPIQVGLFNCPTGCNLQVRLVSGSAQLLELFVLGGTLGAAAEVPADSVFAQPAVPEVLGITAIDASNPGNATVEFFASRGPSTIVFPQFEQRQKPNLAGIDGVSVSGAGGFPTTFFGTSAAVAHAAGIAALVLEASPGLSPTLVQDLLQLTAVPLGSPVPNFDAGFGRIDAFAAIQFLKSPLVSFLANLYAVVLGRAPDPGAAGWASFLRTNCNADGLRTVADAFFDSEEFRTDRPLTLTGLVTVLYQALLGRSPDPGGLASRTEVFRGERLALATQGFIPSPEFQNLLPDPTDAAAVTAVVTRFYTEILGREPDPPGLAGWVNFIVTTGNLDAVAVAFLTSPEFEARPLTFRDYVTVLYRAFLGRDPDAAGLDGWEEALRADLLQVVNGDFIPSGEFQGRIPGICGS